MRISIVGTGYVGLVTGAGLAELGHEVACVDRDLRKLETIESGESPIFEPGLRSLIRKHGGSNLTASADLFSAVRGSDVTFIAVGTPFANGAIDLTQVETAATEIGKAVRDKEQHHTVVVKSTVIPGTTESVVRPILERESGVRIGEGLSLTMNPEFLREGQAVSDFLHPDRLVFGSVDDEGIRVMSEIYAGLGEVPKIHTDPTTAETIKYAANSLLATLISFSNEIAAVASASGVDAVDVMRGVHLDRRLSSAVSGEPAGIVSYLAPGCGFGGSCFPKDVSALISYGETLGLEMSLLDSVMGINRGQPEKMIELVEKHFQLRGLKVAVLGVAFKPETDDIRESPALKIIESLLSRGAEVTAYDPVALGAIEPIFGARIGYGSGLSEVVSDVEAVLVVTMWSEFKELPKLVRDLPVVPLVVDGRRSLEPSEFERYEAIGYPKTRDGYQPRVEVAPL